MCIIIMCCKSFCVHTITLVIIFNLIIMIVISVSIEPALSYFINPSEHVVAMATTHSMSLVIVCNTIDKTHSIFDIKTAQVEVCVH